MNSGLDLQIKMPVMSACVLSKLLVGMLQEESGGFPCIWHRLKAPDRGVFAACQHSVAIKRDCSLAHLR